ncbi:MAG: NAD(P)-dependent alcohol dehydrogenase [Verrucomicrobiota bacterium JB022]|nr:NAD(P)-dependent alcohol dehydrogenase [Verrucomicrobiota bacterium JB022]
MIHAYAIKEKGGKLEPFEYDPGPLGPYSVEIEVDHCGVCHSDLSMTQNDWGMTKYPLIPGHEVSGRIGAVGEMVEHLKVGQRVGLGWHKGYCLHCEHCMDGDHNLCPDAAETIVGHHGGFADRVRAQATAVFPLPDALDPADAGPLLCGGITVFHPMVEFGLRPTDRVGVIGIGGLGHLALQFANAWGCEVTAFTSESKFEEAKQMGAHHTVNSRDDDAIKQLGKRFDLIISTVNVSLNWDQLLGTLRPKGRFHQVGAVLEPMKLSAFSLLTGQKSLSASPVGSPSNITKMLDFAARHEIKPVTEHFKMADVNEAFEHLESGKARYRIVLDR